MQLARLHIQNFKGIDDLEISFLKEGTEEPRPVTLLLGDNGSGKTTVLQAIALVLSLATRKFSDVTNFDWPGFLPARVSSRGKTRVELEVMFGEDELTAIREAFDLELPGEDSYRKPGRSRRMTLLYENGTVVSPQGIGAERQFWGRRCIEPRLNSNPSLRQELNRLGDVFWFDQYRNLAHLSLAKDRGVGALRQYLIGWWGVHTSSRRAAGPDYLALLEKGLADLFPGTRFIGVESPPGQSTPTVSDMYFLIEREGRVYDIAEMSSGEQAIFPLLYQFIRLSIARSVVLIDELELHLHPPQQQALMAALRRIGPDCQFIVTSHSPHLEQVTPDEDEVRLPGGRRCL